MDVKERTRTWINLQQAVRVLDAALEQSVRVAAGLSLAEYEALFRLKLATDHPLHMREMAEQLINSPSGMTRIADRLERDGLISRETPRDNRRVVVVRLTARGEGVLEKADEAFKQTLGESFTAHLTDGDLADLRRLMRKLLESNGAWTDARCSPGAPPASS